MHVYAVIVEYSLESSASGELFTMLHTHVPGLPSSSCSEVNAAFLKIPLIFPAEPNSHPKNAAEKMQQDYDFCRTFAKNYA